MFDDIYATAEEIEEICTNSAIASDSVRGHRWFYTAIWSEANSGTWNNFYTGQEYSEENMRWHRYQVS